MRAAPKVMGLAMFDIKLIDRIPKFETSTAQDDRKAKIELRGILRGVGVSGRIKRRLNGGQEGIIETRLAAR